MAAVGTDNSRLNKNFVLIFLELPGCTHPPAGGFERLLHWPIDFFQLRQQFPMNRR